MSQLKKQLGLMHVFSVAAGAMISSGLFVLPAIAFSKAGPGVVLSYVFASILMLPSLFSKAELSTAMPKAGGTYFYVERSLGTALGLFSGMADWFSLALKSAFSIVGMAVLIQVLIELNPQLHLSEIHLKEIGVVCCILFTILNFLSVRHTGILQMYLVFILLSILVIFVVFGVNRVEVMRYEGFLDKGWLTIFSTAGLVFISFGGLTKITTIAEEVKEPAKNVPLGMLLAWFIVSIFYFLCVLITVGVLDAAALSDTLLPLSAAAFEYLGLPGFILMALAAVTAFITTANGGILAASRSPMAMSRDRLLPLFLSKIHPRFHTPHISIFLTGGFMTIAIIFLEIEALVKTASTLMIILFMLDNLSVIVMRESRIQSYRPAFKSPLYPYLQIAAVILYALLIIDMGIVPLAISAGFIMISITWYLTYAHAHVGRASAVMHIVERVTDKTIRTVTLEDELRDILKQRDEIIEDRFDHLIKHCEIIDLPAKQHSDQIFRRAASVLSERFGENEYVLFEKFLERERQGPTIVQPGLAIPHVIVEGQHKFDIIVIRAAQGIKFPQTDELVHMMFVLAGSRDERNYHLRALMAIAQITQEKNFEKRFMQARDIEGIRNLILLSSRKRDEM